jgi:hypothetical protein
LNDEPDDRVRDLGAGADGFSLFAEAFYFNVHAACPDGVDEKCDSTRQPQGEWAVQVLLPRSANASISSISASIASFGLSDISITLLFVVGVWGINAHWFSFGKDYFIRPFFRPFIRPFPSIGRL